jgi:hypothetical protein
MTENFYLDISEKCIHNWCKSVFGIKSKDAPQEHMCLLYTDKVNGKDRCFLLYTDVERPPFITTSHRIYSPGNYEKTKFLWKALKSNIEGLFRVIADMEDPSNKEFYDQIKIANDVSNLSFAFYPSDVKLVKDKYPHLKPNVKAINRKYDLFKWYIKKHSRIVVHIVEMKELSPPETHTDLLKNYFQ